jgi:hypothetical protein
MSPPLEHCSITYAEFWFTIEEGLVAGLKSGSRSERLRALQKAAGYFRVARTLQKKYDIGERLELVLNILDDGRPACDERDVVAHVFRIRDEVGKQYGDIAPLSAATKFLWLLHRDPYVIYDRQARKALRSPDGDYSQFLERWNEQYAALREQICEISRTLPGRRCFLSCGDLISDQDVAEVAQQEWFWKRIHDIYLWTMGSRELS